MILLLQNAQANCILQTVSDDFCELKIAKAKQITLFFNKRVNLSALAAILTYKLTKSALTHQPKPSIISITLSQKFIINKHYFFMILVCCRSIKNF